MGEKEWEADWIEMGYMKVHTGSQNIGYQSDLLVEELLKKWTSSWILRFGRITK